jgi:hypothetical protein
VNDELLKSASKSLTLLEQREIEASVVGPLVRAMMQRFGEEPATEVLAEVVRELARKSGSELAKKLGDSGLRAFATNLATWTAGDALRLEVIENTDDKLSFNVTRCQYAEMYRRLGLEDLGGTLSCLRDFELASGFNPSIRLVRTQTLMEGASHCDFRFEMISEAE